MELENSIKNNIEINKNQNNFLQTVIGKTINTGIDFGLRAVLPDLIENQVIDIKNSLIKNGLKEGINTAIKSAIDLGKSALGIVTGDFQNMSQIQMAIGSGGIIDTISNLLDKTANKAYQGGYIDKNINSLIKKGKNIILDNISNNIKNEIKNQNNLINNVEKNIKNWKEFFNNKNFEGMEKEYKNIEMQMKKMIPLENIIKEIRNVENIHKLISKNGHNFEITDLEKSVMQKL